MLGTIKNIYTVVESQRASLKIKYHHTKASDFPGGSDSKASMCSAGDLGSIPGWGRSSGEGYGNPLQYSCLEKPIDRGAW